MSEWTERFRTFKTDHCVTGSMRDVYEFHEYPISEDLLLGLGAGVGFIYWHMKGMTPFLGGRANTGRSGEEGLEVTAGCRTGVAVKCLQTASAAKAEKALREALDCGPVMVRVDMGFLPYLGLPDGYHFGGHVIVVVGYDSDGNALIADRDGQLHRILAADLTRARGSKFKPFPPRNALFSFDFSGKHAPSGKGVRQAIGEVVKGMLHAPISNLGVRGIRKAATRVRRWSCTMTEEELRNASFNAFVFIDSTGGTGGGIFRYMYGRFLKEASEITGERGFQAVGRQMRAIGDRWQEAAALFEEAASPASGPAALVEAADILAEIADQEEAAWERLQALA